MENGCNQPDLPNGREDLIQALSAPKTCQEAGLWKTSQAAENTRKIFLRKLVTNSTNLLH
jgi:hypothetical protein